ncbi:NADH-quinone oxidoreductase subunit H [Bdellovibrionota bacterium FG-1]
MKLLPWLHAFSVLVLPIFLIGIIQRTKSIWAGRKGPQLNQFYYSLRRLLHKTPIYSDTTSWVFQGAPLIFLASVFTAALFVPLFPGYVPVSFSYDFVFFAYLIALGRVFTMLGALDTGSSFEGMGASREATYSALIEPAFFAALGTLALLAGKTSFQEIFMALNDSPLTWAARSGCLIALFILLQVESSRIPVDDPNTHLELTMIHEVMILDHSGPELAALEYGTAIKTTLLCGLIASLLNPLTSTEASEKPLLGFAVSMGLMIGLAVCVGLIESWIARLRLRAVPKYAFVAFWAAAFSLALLLIRGECQ